MTEADEFRKSAETYRQRRLRRCIDQAWNQGFWTGFIMATIACAVIVMFLRTL